MCISWAISRLQKNKEALHAISEWGLMNSSLFWRGPSHHPRQKIHQLVVLYVTLSSRPEKAMASHSSTLAWKIPWTEEPHRLQSMGSQRVEYDWATSLSLFTVMHWRRKWQPTPVFLPGESQGRGSPVGCRLWGRTESDTTEATATTGGSSNIFHCVCKPHVLYPFVHWWV